MRGRRAVLISILLAAINAGAQQPGCKPGDYQIGEDEKNIYCESVPSRSALEQIGDYLRDYQGDSAMIGVEWRFRKALIDELGCLARDQAAYRWGGRPPVGAECVRGAQRLEMDCSGALAHAAESGAYAACAVSTVYFSAAKEALKLRNMTARQQMQYFARHGALQPPATRPRPGDAVFFERTTRNQDPYVTHVAIYLGRNPAGRDLILHASYSSQKVVFGAITPWLQSRIVGYGNVSKLFTSLSR